MRYTGFEPVFDRKSRILILGSFPSVISRKEEFYYANKQNRFWRTLAFAFDAPLPQTIDQKKEFVLSRGIALWDIVAECEIEGSMDKDIKNYTVIDLSTILDHADIKRILLNGGAAYNIFAKFYRELDDIAVKLPSTSSANVKFDISAWQAALNEVKEIK